LIGDIDAGRFLDGEDLIALMRHGLEMIGDQATDTVVKENVRNALLAAVEQAGLEVDRKGIYGW
jgi:hypothetical protein